MHLISLHPARRIFHVILAVFLPMLVGCGGRNGTFVSAPPPAGVNLTDLTNATQLQVDQFFAKINGDGLSQSASMLLDGQINFQTLGDMQLIFDGVEQQLDLQFVTGTLFVADTIEAGLVIGLETRQGALFSIMALGQIPN